MKSIKKFASLFFALMLGASLMAVPAVAFADMQQDSKIASSISDGDYVIDRSGLMTQSDVDRLNKMAQEVRSDYDVTAVYVTVDSLSGYGDAQDFAEAFIETYGLDKATKGGCVVFALCVKEGEFGFASAGNVTGKIDSSTLNHFVNEINPYLGRADWAGAGETFYGDVSQTLSGTTANSTSSVPYNGTYVTDDYGLFSDEQRASLEAQATELAEKYDMGVYLLVVDNMGSQNPTAAQRTNFATSFYRANDLGLGDGHDGIMLVIAPGSRDYVTIAYGQGSYSFSDEGIAAMEEAVTDKLHDDDWYGGSKAYYDKIGEELEYYSVKGEPWREPDFLSLILKVIAIIGIPAAFAFSKVGGEKRAMQTAVEKQEASDYMDASSFAITSASDDFVNTTLSVVPIPKHEDNDSGGSSFGGGGWGGGGGGGFSSSGGGKF